MAGQRRTSATLNNGLQIPRVGSAFSQPAHLLLSLPLQSNFMNCLVESQRNIGFTSVFGSRKIDDFDHVIVYVDFRGTRLCKKRTRKKKRAVKLKTFLTACLGL